MLFYPYFCTNLHQIAGSSSFSLGCSLWQMEFHEPRKCSTFVVGIGSQHVSSLCDSDRLPQFLAGGTIISSSSQGLKIIGSPKKSIRRLWKRNK